MATESVPAKAPSDLPGLMRADLGNDVPFFAIGREHCVSFVAALSDLLIGGCGQEGHHQPANDTLADAAWLAYELTRAIQAFDACAAKAKGAA